MANTANTVSVGSSGNARKIVNVADGAIASGSAEAVTGGQLYTTNQNLATTNTNLTTLQTQVGNGTIGLVQQSASGQPITVGAATNGTVVDFTGTAGTRTLTGVSAGTLASGSTDAVNGGQLFTTNQNLSSLQTQLGNGTIGLVQQSAANQPITVGASAGGTSVDFTGTSGARTLTGISAGTLSSGSADAVNGGQIYTANQRVAMAFGSTLDANGQLNAPSYTIQSTAYGNVGSAFGAVDSALTANSNSIATLQSQLNSGSIGLVQQNSGTRVITVGATTDGTVVDMSGTAGNRQVTGVANGALTATSTDAVNGSQLHATNQQVATNTAAIGTLTGQVATNTSDIATLNTTVAGISQSGSYTRVNSTGPGATASGANAIAIGSGAQATQTGAIAMGTNASSTGANAIAIGSGATATGSVAVGAQASAAGGGAAFGDRSTATGANSSAFGPDARATAANSTAIGYGSVASAPNTVSVGYAGGERRITNVAAGVNPTDAVNMSQLQSVASSVGVLGNTLNEVDRRAIRGIAATAAMTSPGMPSAPGRTSWAINTAAFNREVGVGLSMAHRLNIDIPIYLSGGYSSGGGREHVVRAGLGGEF